MVTTRHIISGLFPRVETNVELKMEEEKSVAGPRAVLNLVSIHQFSDQFASVSLSLTDSFIPLYLHHLVASPHLISISFCLVTCFVWSGVILMWLVNMSRHL